MPIQKINLSGENAFYKVPNYYKATKDEFSYKKVIDLPVTYTCNTENKITRIAKKIFSTIVFPIGIYQALHNLAGKIIVLSSNPNNRPFSNNVIEMRTKISLNKQWKYKRIHIKVDDHHIDAMIIGKTSTLDNGKWILASNGNGEFYEDHLHNDSEFKQILSEMKGNGLVFNYPGVAGSSGGPNRQAMTKAYHAMLSFLEDKENGIGAKEIIGYGHSIGGGVQGEGLKTYQLKKDIKYVFVKSRTFSNLSLLVSSALDNKALGHLVKILGWNIDSVTSSKNLKVPEIILQTAQNQNFYQYKELNNSSTIINDSVITKEASLAKILLDDANCSKENKLFIGITESHNVPLKNPKLLAEKVNNFLHKKNSIQS